MAWRRVEPLLEEADVVADHGRGEASMACRNRIAIAATTHHSASEDGSVGDCEGPLS